MDLQLLPIDRRWISQELAPYLRCSFSHAIPFEADIWPQIQSALQFCMHKPSYPTDGDDLLFERICQAIEFRHLKLAPDLRMVTDNLEPLAKFLIRRAQLKGSYELLGLMNIASGAWREYEDLKLKKLKEAAEIEQEANKTAPFPRTPKKPAPTDDLIDPRLVHSLQGHFVLPDDSGILSVADDQYFRHQNHLLVERRRYDNVAPSWHPQPRQATASHPHTAVQPGREWSYGHVAHGQQHAPSYVQYSGQRHDSFAVQPPIVTTVASNNNVMGSPLQRWNSTRSIYQPLAPGGPAHRAPAPPQQKWTFAHQGALSQLQHYPVQPGSTQNVGYPPALHDGRLAATSPGVAGASDVAPAQGHLSGSAAIPVADIAHLRGNEWAEQAQQRVRQFSGLSQDERAHKIMELHHAQATPGPLQSVLQQPQHSFQQYPQQHGESSSSHAMLSFANHPGFSNVRSTFPSTQSMAAMSRSNHTQLQLQSQNDDVRVTCLPFGTDSNWK